MTLNLSVVSITLRHKLYYATVKVNNNIVYLFHLYLPVSKKRRSAIFWTNPHLLRSCQFPSFPVASLTSS